MAKRFMCLIIVSILVFSFAGCSGKNGAQETVSGSGQTTVSESTGTAATESIDMASQEKIKVKFITCDFVGAPLEATQLSYVELAKRTNVEFEFELVPEEQYDEKTNLLISSNDLPDIMYIKDWNIVSKYSDDGIFTDLKSIYEKFGQNALKEIGKDVNLLKDLRDDNGRMFYIPRMDWSMLNLSLFYDVDLLKQTGDSVPTTIDELYGTMVKMKKLGSDVAPFGAGIWTNSVFQPIYNAFGTTEPLSKNYLEGWITAGGKRDYAIYSLQEKTKAAIKWLSKCYKEGLIEKEYYTLSDDDKKARLVEGKVGFSYEWQDGIGIFREGGGWDMNLSPILPLKGPFGDQLMEYRYPIVARFVIPSSSKHADRIMQLYDYLATDEGKILMNWGVEGDTFVTENGSKKYTDKIMKGENDPGTERRLLGLDSIYFPHFMDYDSWAQTVDPEVVTHIDECKPFFKIEYPAITGTSEELKSTSQISADVDMLVDEYVQKFIIGELDVDAEWDNMIRKMEDMGVKKLIEISDAQYARWKNR